MSKIKDFLKTRQPLEDVEAINTKGLRLDNTKSSIKTPPPPIDVEGNKARLISNRADQNEASFELASRLLTIIKDRTVEENKSPKEKEYEMDVLRELVSLAMLINNDQTQDEGAGSVGFCAVLAKAILIYRDRINELEYEMEQLKKMLKQTNK